MLWNTILAVIPVILAIVFFKRTDQPEKRVSTFVLFLQLGVVMLFLPNAPYVATDLIHFVETVRQSDRNLWKLLATEFPLYLGFVLLGITCYCFVTDRMLFVLKRTFGKKGYFSGLLLIPLLSSIGVYLGRVARFNSWDILQNPLHIARSSANVLEDARMIKIVLAMGFLLMFAHLLYKIFHDGLKVRVAKYKAQREALERLVLKRRQGSSEVGASSIPEPIPVSESEP